jgi:large subunit ribosomal protein L21
MYAIVKVGGKQYRVEKGDSLLVDRMPEDEGAKVTLEPLLLAGGGKDAPLFRGDDLGKVSVEATVTGHERGPKIHVLKFKPKRGYKRRQGHRSELTRLEIGEIHGPGGKAKQSKAAKPAAEAKAEAKPAAEAKPEAKPAKDQGDKLEGGAKTKASATTKKAATEAKPAEPVKDQGDKLEEGAKTKATPKPKPKKPAEKKPAEKKPAADKKPSSEEEPDGS